MDLKIALLVGLVVGLIAAAIWLWPSPVTILLPAAEIAMEDATGQWTVVLRPNSDLISDAATVLPRIRTGHAATSSLVSPLSPSRELNDVTANVASRIVVEHAATASSVSIGNVAAQSLIASPRVVVENAATVSTVRLGITTAPSTIASPRVLVEHAATVIPIGPIDSSCGLQSDSARVSTKLLIENAEIVDTKPLEAMPPLSLGE